MEMFKVSVNQRVDGKSYSDTIHAKFGDIEQAMIYGEMSLCACENTTIEIEIVDEEAICEE